MSLGTVGMIMLDLTEFLDEIKPSIKWSSSTGYHRCTGCGAQLDSTSKLSHWLQNCSLSKDKTAQKLRARVFSDNFPVKEKLAIKEAGLDWYQNQIKINDSLPIEFKPTGAAINQELYPSSLKELSCKDIQDLADLFSGKIICRVKQVYTKDPIIDQLPMNDLDSDPTMFSCPEWLKDHNRAIEETHALGLYAESISKGICDLPDCFCHELASMKEEREKKDEF